MTLGASEEEPSILPLEPGRPILIEPGGPGESPVSPDPISSPWDSNWKCKWVPNCPGGQLRKASGAYAGCTKVFGFNGCIGECKSCTGSANSVDMCVPASVADSCWFVGGGGSGGQNVNCGTITYQDDCQYSATVPTGEPFATPNKCYCGGASRPSTDPCTFAPCNNPTS